MEINYTISKNFLGDTIPYSADLLMFLRGYESKFPGLTKLHVELKELPYYQIGYDKTAAIRFLDENKQLEIKLSFHHYYDRNGQKTGSPSVWQVYDQIKLILNRAIDEYTKL